MPQKTNLPFYLTLFHGIATLLPLAVSLDYKFTVMKRFLFFAFFAILVSNLVVAQAYEGTTKYAKKTQRAILIDYNYPQEAVQNAFVTTMAKLGYKPKEEKGIFNRDKGFLVFNTAYVTDISDQAMDYIINVERSSRKDNDKSTLYLIMTKGDENAMEKMSAEDIANAKLFLSNLLPAVEAANLELEIKAQQDVVAKAEKKLKDLKDDQASLEKKLQDNKTNQESTQSDIESQKQKLGTLIGQRKIGDGAN